MTSSSNAPQEPYQPSTEQVNDAGESAGRGPSLDDVVRETLDAQGGAEGLSPEMRDAFGAIGRRHRDQQTLELPVVEELVEAVLTCRFEQFRSQPELRAAAANRIAQTLWEDSPSRERLDRLWNKLREES